MKIRDIRDAPGNPTVEMEIIRKMYDLISDFVEKDLQESIEKLFCAWPGDIREIPKFIYSYYQGDLKDWLGEEIEDWIADGKGDEDQ